MHLGDLGFIAAFIILPILIVVLCVSGLRTLGRRARQSKPDASTWGDPEQTSELPVQPPRDWAATVKPTRGRAQAHTQTEARQFRPPAYRGRSGGTVRRMDSTAARRARGSGGPQL